MAFDDQKLPELPKTTVQLLRALQDYRPTVPEELSKYYIQRAGSSGEPDETLVRLISAAAERFVSTVIYDAVQIAKRRLQQSSQVRRPAGHGAAGKDKDKAVARTILTADDLAEALREFGINSRTPPYHVNVPPPR